MDEDRVVTVLLDEMLQRDGSNLYLATGRAPMVRVRTNGDKLWADQVSKVFDEADLMQVARWADSGAVEYPCGTLYQFNHRGVEMTAFLGNIRGSRKVAFRVLPTLDQEKPHTPPGERRALMFM